MNSKCEWEIRRVSTPERIFKKISEEMLQPIGIIIFGVDSELKDEVVVKCKRQLRDAKIFHGAPSTHEMADLIHSGQTSVFVLSEMESCNHELRRECLKVMLRLGAVSIVGIYVDVTEAKNESKQYLNKLKKNPPTADDLDYLVVVKEEGKV